MHDLKQWLAWATTETHVSAEERASKSFELEIQASDMVDDAARLLMNRGNPDRSDGDATEDITWCLTHHPDAFRDLCLSFAEAVERMREVVPETVSEPEPTPERRAELINDAADGMAYACGITRPALEAWWKRDNYLENLTDAARLVNQQIAAADERQGRLMQYAGMLARGEMVIGADFGSEPGETVAMPKATALGDGTHCLDVVCACGAYIIRSGTIYLSADGLRHTGPACGPRLTPPSP